MKVTRYALIKRFKFLLVGFKRTVAFLDTTRIRFVDRLDNSLLHTLETRSKRIGKTPSGLRKVTFKVDKVL